MVTGDELPDRPRTGQQTEERMAEESPDYPGETDVTAFVSGTHYVVGAGETMDAVQTRGEWLATDDPVEVRR